MDVDEDRRWLSPYNPRVETIGLMRRPGGRRGAHLERWCLDALLSQARIISWAIQYSYLTHPETSISQGLLYLYVLLKK